MIQKNNISDLAKFGGTPFSAEKLYVGRPNIGDRVSLLARINEVLDNRWLTNDGPYLQEFEQKIAAMLGVKHCIAMCNATVALEIVIRALGCKGEVIVPSFTFIATAHALQWQEITPVFCDIDPRNHMIDPRRVEELITPRTSAIIGVHLWGQLCDTDSLAEIANRHKLKLIFDAAHSFACSRDGQLLGSFGDAEVFSFHATKFFNTFEGGAVTTNNDELASRIGLMRNFGFSGNDRVIYIGTNGKMMEVSAAMGLTGLESLKEFIAINRRNYQQYQSELANMPGVKMLTFNEQDETNYQYIVLEVDEDVIGISRDQLLDLLWAENVFARRYFYPGCHQMEPYRSFFPAAGLLLPETEKLVKRVLVLPTGTAVGQKEIEGICQVIRVVVSNGHDIKKRLSVT
ncbi:MAG TPA: aminotransferase class I/II-fold pyridoxal phosphate-dependent enzyme [Pyrinomonadaceae bacterium]|nr:aminotransferase class I/II-fold pyridoxal phosphate-dependent enzyme [Pyrinomonadaceae bacterium]